MVTRIWNFKKCPSLQREWRSRKSAGWWQQIYVQIKFPPNLQEDYFPGLFSMQISRSWRGTPVVEGSRTRRMKDETRARSSHRVLTTEHLPREEKGACGSKSTQLIRDRTGNKICAPLGLQACAICGTQNVVQGHTPSVNASCGPPESSAHRKVLKVNALVYWIQVMYIKPRRTPTFGGHIRVHSSLWKHIPF